MLKNILRFILLITTISPSTQARDQINIVGSSTVYPFAIVVAEKFGKTTEFKTPKIESTGSGGGLKLFCAGVGTRHPDFTNSSRAIKENEIKKCRKNSVGDITEVKVGYDGVVIANAKSSKIFKMTRMDLYLALAAEIPNPDGSETFIKNPHKTWKDVNPELPTIKIEVLGPPPTSGTRDAFVELAMEKGAKSISSLAELRTSSKNGKIEFEKIAHTIREDGAFIEAGENDNLIIQKLIQNPNAIGIFGFSFLDQNTDKVQGSIVNSAIPSFDNILQGKYPISRSLFFYVKKNHIRMKPSLKEYVKEFTSSKAIGNDGYLVSKGLIPLSEDLRAKFEEDGKKLNKFDSKVLK